MSPQEQWSRPLQASRSGLTSNAHSVEEKGKERQIRCRNGPVPPGTTSVILTQRIKKNLLRVRRWTIGWEPACPFEILHSRMQVGSISMSEEPNTPHATSSMPASGINSFLIKDWSPNLNLLKNYRMSASSRG